MLKTSKYLPLVCVAVAAVSLGGCASGLGGTDYSRAQTRTVQQVQMGVVQAVHEVNIEGTKSSVGSGAGAIIGGVAGSDIGGGKGSIVAATIGAVLGGLGGAAVEEGVTRQKGLEITIKLDSGRHIAITQAADVMFNVGDRVRVLSGGGTTRVSY